MKRNQFFIALSLLACTLLSCQNEKKQQSSIANKSNMEKNDTILKPFVAENLFWIREPKQYTITDSLITIVSEPHTDLWQRTYYGFSNDNAPVLQMKTSNKFFSFTVKTSFNSSALFDQCGIAIYLDSDNWMKASIEYENEEYQRLGSVVTNNGYSDWATHDIPSSIKEMWYRLSRRGSDYYIETSPDGITFTRCVHSIWIRVMGRSRSEYMRQARLTIHSPHSSLKWKSASANGNHGQRKIQDSNRLQTSKL